MKITCKGVDCNLNRNPFVCEKAETCKGYRKTVEVYPSIDCEYICNGKELENALPRKDF